VGSWDGYEIQWIVLQGKAHVGLANQFLRGKKKEINQSISATSEGQTPQRILYASVAQSDALDL